MWWRSRLSASWIFSWSTYFPFRNMCGRFEAHRIDDMVQGRYCADAPNRFYQMLRFLYILLQRILRVWHLNNAVGAFVWLLYSILFIFLCSLFRTYSVHLMLHGWSTHYDVWRHCNVIRFFLSFTSLTWVRKRKRRPINSKFDFRYCGGEIWCNRVRFARLTPLSLVWRNHSLEICDEMNKLFEYGILGACWTIVNWESRAYFLGHEQTSAILHRSRLSSSPGTIPKLSVHYARLEAIAGMPSCNHVLCPIYLTFLTAFGTVSSACGCARLNEQLRTVRNDCDGTSAAKMPTKNKMIHQR